MKSFLSTKIIIVTIIWWWIILLSWCKATVTPTVGQFTWNIQTQNIQKIYVLGDSLSAWYQLPLEQSYPMVLEKILTQAWYKIKVINAWESWDTSAWLKERLERLTQDANTWDITLIVIWWNDWLQWLSTKNLRQNIKDIAMNLQQKWLKTIIWWMQIPTNLWNDYREAFRIVYIDVAQETNSPLIPFILSWVGWIPELNLKDWIHPNATWQSIVANTVKEFLISNSIITIQ